MLARLQLHATYQGQQGRSTVFLDSDMLMVRPLPQIRLASNEVLLCRRSLDRTSLFNPGFMGGLFAEYSGQTIDQVHPALACFTATPNISYWISLLSALSNIDRKFQLWYGDQEAMRRSLGNLQFSFKMIPEAIAACLPEAPQAREASILHFKGRRRKQLLLGKTLGV
ncbi:MULTISPECIES: hypothetical protein [unclassified Synechococcus]|uniref:hypothetical protein n=1 Tax=unclassified Synechococcus TaxID=2626047 RepID=UPI001E4B540A|nr:MULTISPECIES: hypothetical protein [unclassified Synechococcus]WFN59524.1 hypothetical protein N4320_02630 [Synechococcus sp. CCFWC 502]